MAIPVQTLNSEDSRSQVPEIFISYPLFLIPSKHALSGSYDKYEAAEGGL